MYEIGDIVRLEDHISGKKLTVEITTFDELPRSCENIGSILDEESMERFSIYRDMTTRLDYAISEDELEESTKVDYKKIYESCWREGPKIKDIEKEYKMGPFVLEPGFDESMDEKYVKISCPQYTEETYNILEEDMDFEKSALDVCNNYFKSCFCFPIKLDFWDAEY